MPQKRIDMTGQRYGRWLVAEPDPEIVGRWLCVCDCGCVKSVDGDSLRRGHSSSCGCWQKEEARKLMHDSNTSRNTTHGCSKTPLYRVWAGMITRCQNRNSSSYAAYGGRGIQVCDEWQSFENFLRDMGDGYRDNLTLDRINNNGNYELDNCRWATRQVQMRNRRRNRHVVIDGESVTVAEAAERTGMGRTTIYARLNRGWSRDSAATLPIGTHFEKED